MSPTRRRFLQSLSAGALAAGLPRWAYARTFDPSREQAPAVRDPKYREWSAAALGEAKRLGCSYADIRFTRNRSQNIAVRNGQIMRAGGGGGFGPARRRDRDLRLRRPRDSQRRLGLRQQPARHARRDQARHRHRHRRRARQRGREEARRAARAGAGLRRVLAGADREGSVGGAARRKDRHAPRRDRDDAEEPVGAVRGRDGRLRARVEIPGDQRRVVHRAGVPFHQLQPRRDRAHRHAR